MFEILVFFVTLALACVMGGLAFTIESQAEEIKRLKWEVSILKQRVNDDKERIVIK